MDMMQICLYHVLLLGYTVLHTDAVVTVTPHNTLSDGVSFEKGSEGVIMCTISPYTGYFTWKIDNSVAADCLPMCTVYSTVANYAFTFDTSNGIFNITINPINDTDNGKVFLCDDGSAPVSFTVTVEEKILPTGKIVIGSWCTVKNEEKWCYLIIGLTTGIPAAGLYVVELILVVVKYKRKKEENPDNHAVSEIIVLEQELKRKRANCQSEFDERDSQWRKQIEQCDREKIENEESKLTKLRQTVETRNYLLKRKQTPNTKTSSPGETEWAKYLTNELKLEYYKIKRNVLDLQINQRVKIEIEGEKELTRRKDEMEKGYQYQHSLTEKEKEMKWNKMPEEMESLINDIVERENNQSHNNELGREESGMKLRREIENLEETYRTKIEREMENLRITIQNSTEEIQDNHANNILKIGAMEEELNQTRRKVLLRGWRAKGEQEFMKMIAAEEIKLEGQRNEEGKDRGVLDKKANREDIKIKRKILDYQRHFINFTLTLGIAEFEHMYGRRKNDKEDGQQRKRTKYDELREQLKQSSALEEFMNKSPNRQAEGRIAELRRETEEITETYKKKIDEEEKRLEREGNSCSIKQCFYIFLLLLPYMGLIVLLVSKCCEACKRRHPPVKLGGQSDGNYQQTTAC